MPTMPHMANSPGTWKPDKALQAKDLTLGYYLVFTAAKCGGSDLSGGLRVLFLACCPGLTQARGRVLLNDLPPARDSQGVRRDVVGDDRAGGDVGTVADAHRRHQGGIRADEGALA